MSKKLKLIATEAFESFKPLYPSYTQFLNKIKYNHDNQTVKENREYFTEFYANQPIVQIFQPPPFQDALRKTKGYYPATIAFYPFERIYSDIGTIRIYPFSKKEEIQKKKKEKKQVVFPKPAETKPIEEKKEEEPKPQAERQRLEVASATSQEGWEEYKGVLIPRVRYEGKEKKELSQEEYLKNLGGEKKYPPELRHVYISSGKRKTGTQKGNIMSEELKQKRKEYLEKK